MNPRCFTYCLGTLALAAAMALSGCANYLAPFKVSPARPGMQSQLHRTLTTMPAPAEKVVVAVYRFRHQTGQYKASDRLASWSTAVTQGSTTILMRALEESGWFVPIERENLSNLLNERQIIQQVRAQHTGPDGKPLGPLPPLLYAGVLIEGGIVGYDSNVLSSGIGIRYFGAGGDGEFRQDQVTIYLRVVSTQNGQVLKTVHTTKTIVSQKVDGSLFRYVDPKRLLEAETGYSFNEPPVIAVTEAIEEGVKNLIIEGVRENLWALKDANDARSEVFQAYDAARADVADAQDYFSQPTQPGNRPGLALGLAGGALRFESDYKNTVDRADAEAYLRLSVARNWSVGLSAQTGELATDHGFSRRHTSADAHLLYYLLPQYRLTPFVLGGGGLLMQQNTRPDEDGMYPYLTAGAGLEWMLSPRFGLNVTLSNQYPLKEGLDGVRKGRVNDNIWALKTGISVYPF